MKFSVGMIVKLDRLIFGTKTNTEPYIIESVGMDEQGEYYFVNGVHYKFREHQLIAIAPLDAAKWRVKNET